MEMKNRESPPEGLDQATDTPANLYPDATSRDVATTWISLVVIVVLAIVGGYLLT